MYLVTGASGQLGQRVLHHLLETLVVPAEKIVAASRTPEKLAAWAERGVNVRALDFEDPATFSAALKDVTRALLVSTDALDRPGRRLEQHRNALAAFSEAGVSHVIYTSMPHPEDSPLLIAPDHLGTEQAVRASAIPGWTILRNHWYFENLFMFAQGAIATGQWYAADEGQPSADISRDDLALAAATALAKDAGQNVYTLSGLEALTKAQFAEKLGAALGKTIEVVQVPLEGLVQGMIGAGLPEPLARVFASFDTNTAAGRVATVTSDFQTLTGATPQTFDAWLAQNKAGFGAG